MSKRLNQLIAENRNAGRKLLSVFLTAGYPQLNDTPEIIGDLDAAGVDFIELGMPFSDPIADGPVIQKTSEQALKNGLTTAGLFDLVRRTRKHSDIPILLMGYLNPMLHTGIEAFMASAQETGIDGLIIPDWPLEESRQYDGILKSHGLDLIQLLAPNTPGDRIKAIDAASTSFIYCVAYTGVTGKDNKPSPETLQFFNDLRATLTHPLMIGFGIRNRTDFRTYTQYADGVIIGSAFMRLLDTTAVSDRPAAIKKFVQDIRA